MSLFVALLLLLAGGQVDAGTKVHIHMCCVTFLWARRLDLSGATCLDGGLLGCASPGIVCLVSWSIVFVAVKLAGCRI